MLSWFHALLVRSNALFALLTLRDVIYDVTKVRSFSSITPDQIELVSRESHQWTQEYLPNRVICDMTSFDQLRDLRGSDLTLARGQRLKLISPERKSIPFDALEEGEHDAKIVALRPFFGEVIKQKPKPWLGPLDLTSEVTGWPGTLKWGTVS